MPTKKKGSRRRYGKAAGKAVASAMRQEKRGTLRSGKGGKGGVVKSRKQAIAISLRSPQERRKGSEEEILAQGNSYAWPRYGEMIRMKFA